MHNNTRYDRSTNFLELEVNVPRTIGIVRDVAVFAKIAGLVMALFERFTLIQRIFQFLADFTIIAIFAVFAKIAGLVMALFDRFTSTRRIFQFFAKIVIFAAACKPGHISAHHKKGADLSTSRRSFVTSTGDITLHKVKL